MTNALQQYLDRYFVTANVLTQQNHISRERLQELISRQWIPAPSYVVESNGTLHSCAFGAFEHSDAVAADYFALATTDWIQLVEQDWLNGRDPEESIAQQYWQTLTKIDAVLIAESDLFYHGQLSREKAEQWLPTIRRHFVNGVFGVCVVEPRSLLPILRKELAQAALTRLTENGQKKQFSDNEKVRLKPIMTIYDQVCMPFSPLEYPRCSRKRLLDDLRAIVFSQCR